MNSKHEDGWCIGMVKSVPWPENIIWKMSEYSKTVNYLCPSCGRRLTASVVKDDKNKVIIVPSHKTEAFRKKCFSIDDQDKDVKGKKGENHGIPTH